MGEYATFQGQSVKIGTCEDMYYLRFTQRRLLQKEAHSLDPNDPSILPALRFRFPWPDEDQITPGSFDGAYRKIAINGYPAPAKVDHYLVQMSSPHGYLMSIPCPEGPEYKNSQMNMDTTHTSGFRVARNGFKGAAFLVAQKFVGGRLVPIMQCACGAMYRLEEDNDILELAMLVRVMGDRRKGESSETFYRAIADRILAGAALEAPALV